MSATPNRTTLIAIVVAVLCAGWAIYATRHPAGGSSGMGPPGMGGAGMGGPGAGGSGAGMAGRGGTAPGARGPGGAPGGGMPVPVVSQSVREQPISRELKALGTAAANEAVVVTAKSSNLVTAIRFRDGERVARGAVLVELDSAQARADLAAANAALVESTAQYERGRDLLPTQALSKSQFDQIVAAKNANAARVDAARARLEDTVIRAPFSGRVGLRRVSVGSLISPGTVITTLDDSSLIKVDFAVPESNLPALRAGLPVSATSVAYPGKKFSGKVASVDSRVDPTSRSVLVRAELPNGDGLLKPGMFLNVELQRDQRTAIVIPEEALVPEQNRQFVFVVNGGMAEKREVRIGSRSPGSVEIVQGLRAGERIVVEGTVKLRDSGPVRDLAKDLAGAAQGAPRAGSPAWSQAAGQRP
ncbi:MAG: efflux RND transporter periplasmic adaptor subunit [Gammaproteobacteria bacterium]|nr:efflux RND transporter periplasmic adaptor subunit [Gammaproteobacteria bacterium]